MTWEKSKAEKAKDRHILVKFYGGFTHVRSCGLLLLIAACPQKASTLKPRSPEIANT